MHWAGTSYRLHSSRIPYFITIERASLHFDLGSRWLALHSRFITLFLLHSPRSLSFQTTSGTLILDNHDNLHKFTTRTHTPLHGSRMDGNGNLGKLENMVQQVRVQIDDRTAGIGAAHARRRWRAVQNSPSCARRCNALSQLWLSLRADPRFSPIIPAVFLHVFLPIPRFPNRHQTRLGLNRAAAHTRTRVALCIVDR